MKKFNYEVIMIPFQVDQLDLTIDSKVLISAKPDKKARRYKFKHEDLDLSLICYTDNKMICVEIHLSEKIASNQELSIVPKGKSGLKVNDFSLTVNFYLNLLREDHVELCVDFKDIEIKENYFTINLKTISVRNELSVY